MSFTYTWDFCIIFKFVMVTMQHNGLSYKQELNSHVDDVENMLTMATHARFALTHILLFTTVYINIFLHLYF